MIERTSIQKAMDCALDNPWYRLMQESAHPRSIISIQSICVELDLAISVVLVRRRSLRNTQNTAKVYTESVANMQRAFLLMLDPMRFDSLEHRVRSLPTVSFGLTVAPEY